MEIYLCERDAGMHPKKSMDVFFHYNKERYLLKKPLRLQDQVPNRQVDKMLSPNLRIFQFASVLHRLNRMIPRGSEDFVAPLALPFDWRDLLHRYPAHFAFTEEEEERGLSALAEMGVEPGSKFVCFHARDGAFLYRSLPRMVSLFGDWVDQPYRNATLTNFLLAADQLTQRGYYVIRMGKWSKEPLVQDNPRIIDYATRFQSDFADAFLSARCDFFIGTNSGMTSIPMMFRTPLALVNLVPYSELVYAGTKDIYIPKKYYSAQMGRILSFREVLSEPVLISYSGKQNKDGQEYYANMGIEVVENSAEEIADLVMEMEQRLRGTFVTTSEDEELQSRYFSILRSFSNVMVPVVNLERRRIGTRFLRAHPELLE